MPRGQSEGANLRQQPRLWDSYPAKSPNLRNHQARLQNKGLSRASRLRTGPSPAGDRQAEGSWSGRGQSRPREASPTKLQAGFVANQDFLGIWKVDICRESLSQRSAPQKRHRAHRRRRAGCTPRKPSGWDGGGEKTQPQAGATVLAKHLVS